MSSTKRARGRTDRYSRARLRQMQADGELTPYKAAQLIIRNDWAEANGLSAIFRPAAMHWTLEAFRRDPEKERLLLRLLDGAALLITWRADAWAILGDVKTSAAHFLIIAQALKVMTRNSKEGGDAITYAGWLMGIETGEDGTTKQEAKTFYGYLSESYNSARRQSRAYLALLQVVRKICEVIDTPEIAEYYRDEYREVLDYDLTAINKAAQLLQESKISGAGSFEPLTEQTLTPEAQKVILYEGLLSDRWG